MVSEGRRYGNAWWYEVFMRLGLQDRSYLIGHRPGLERTVLIVTSVPLWPGLWALGNPPRTTEPASGRLLHRIERWPQAIAFSCAFNRLLWRAALFLWTMPLLLIESMTGTADL
jgi:hypothetical protein